MSQLDQEAKAHCTRFLSQHRPRDPRSMLTELASHPAAREHADVYGEGGAVASLERRTIDLLGKQSGLFFIKGVAAQLCVLSAYAEARGTSNIALHPMSHIDWDESNAIERVGQLNAIRIGRHAPFDVKDLQGITEPLAAIVIELPLRRAGYLLPDHEALVTISQWCRTRGIPLHFDGARIWEAAAGYGVPIDELVRLADSIYVSFYKGLGGIGGALVAGSSDFIASLAVWKTRYAGNLYTAYPQAISGLIGLEAQLSRMSDYVARARDLAVRLQALPGIMLQPSVPHTNAFQIWMPGEPDLLAARHRSFAHDRKIWLFGGFHPTALASHSMTEIVIGEASDDYAPEEALAWIEAFLASGS